MHTLGYFVLHLELGLLHLKDMLSFNLFVSIGDSWRILEEDRWWSSNKWTFAKVNWHRLGIWI